MKRAFTHAILTGVDLAFYFAMVWVLGGDLGSSEAAVGAAVVVVLGNDVNARHANAAVEQVEKDRRPPSGPARPA